MNLRRFKAKRRALLPQAEEFLCLTLDSPQPCPLLAPPGSLRLSDPPVMAFCKTLPSCVLRGSAGRVSCAESFLRRGQSFNLRLPHGAAAVTCGHTWTRKASVALLPVWALSLAGPDVEESRLPRETPLRSGAGGGGHGFAPRAPPAFPGAAGSLLLLQVATRIPSGKRILALGPRPAFLAERIGFGMSEWRAGACGARVYM